MRTTLLLAVLGLASAVGAQIPLPGFGNTFVGASTRGFWFRAPTSFVIIGLRVPNEALQPFQAVEVLDLGAAPPPAYPGIVSGAQLFYSNSLATGVVISTNIPVQQGAYIGVLGCCTTTVGAASSFNSYGAPPGPFSSNILGGPVTLTRLGTQYPIGVSGTHPCFQEPAFEVGRVEVYVAGTSGYAQATSYGTGCISVPDVSSYEIFASSGSFDLENTSIKLLNTGTGYTAMPGTTTYVPPSGAAVVLLLTDDSETTVSLPASMPLGSTSTNQLTVCSNGFISSGPGNGIAFAPSPAAFLNGVRAWWSVAWHDYNPAATGGGQIKFEVVAGIAYVTWDGVWDFQGTSAASASRFQAQFNLTTGTVHYVYQTMSNFANGFLTGFSDAGPSANPGSMDISAALPGTYTAAVFRVLPLSLAASDRPVMGTSISLDSTNIPAAGVIGVLFLGTTEFTTGVDLTPLGMPGCNLYATLEASATFLPSGGVGSISLFIPPISSLAGAVIVSQSAVFVPGINAFGFIASNGLRLTLDLL